MQSSSESSGTAARLLFPLMGPLLVTIGVPHGVDVLSPRRMSCMQGASEAELLAGLAWRDDSAVWQALRPPAAASAAESAIAAGAAFAAEAVFAAEAALEPEGFVPEGEKELRRSIFI